MFQRPACSGDACDMSRILCHSWKEVYRGMVPQDYLDQLPEDHWTAAFSNWLENRIFQGRILSDGPKPIGCIVYGNSRDEAHPDWGEIVALYLLPEYWGKGGGRELLFAALRDMPQRTVYLWVLRENTRAQRFYKSVGFQPTTDTCIVDIQGSKLVDTRYVLRDR